MFVSWYPRIWAPLVRGAIHALLDEPLRKAFGFEPASPLLGRLVPQALRWRGRLTGLLPARRRPRLRTQIPRRSYRGGYRIGISAPPAPCAVCAGLTEAHERQDAL